MHQTPRSERAHRGHTRRRFLTPHLDRLEDRIHPGDAIGGVFGYGLWAANAALPWQGAVAAGGALALADLRQGPGGVSSARALPRANVPNTSTDFALLSDTRRQPAGLPVEHNVPASPAGMAAAVVSDPFAEMFDLGQQLFEPWWVGARGMRGQLADAELGDKLGVGGASQPAGLPPGSGSAETSGLPVRARAHEASDSDSLFFAINAGLGLAPSTPSPGPTDGDDGSQSGHGGTRTEGVVLTLPCNTLDGWRIVESGGTGAARGSVQLEAGALVLREGNSFLVSLQRDFTIPNNPGRLTFPYSVAFDTSATGFVRDAFEVAFVDGQGKPVVQPLATSRDAYFNVTEGLPAAVGTDTTLDGQTVNVDISRLTPGSTASVLLRLVNNDADTGTVVRITGCDAPPEVNVRLANDTAPEGPGADPYRSDGLTNDPTVAGTATDAQGIRRLEAQVDGRPFQDITATLVNNQYRFTPSQLTPGPHRITVRVTDTGGLTAEAALEFRVNTPPVANAGGNRTADEGDTVPFTGAASTDVEGALFAYRWTFHDNSTHVGLTAARAYPQDGTHPVQLTVTDTAGSQVTDTIQVAVRNLAPVVLTASDLTGVEGQALDFVGTFRDAGVLDTHTATVVWSDGSATRGQVTEAGGQVVTGRDFGNRQTTTTPANRPPVFTSTAPQPG